MNIHRPVQAQEGAQGTEPDKKAEVPSRIAAFKAAASNPDAPAPVAESSLKSFAELEELMARQGARLPDAFRHNRVASPLPWEIGDAGCEVAQRLPAGAESAKGTLDGSLTLFLCGDGHGLVSQRPLRADNARRGIDAAVFNEKIDGHDVAARYVAAPSGKRKTTISLIAGEQLIGIEYFHDAPSSIARARDLAAHFGRAAREAAK